jgi:hypothetical protein
VAENWNVMPGGTAALWGLIARDTSVAELTVKEVELTIDPNWAEIVLVPPLRPAAIPKLPILATVGWDEFQITTEVKSCLLPSLKVPVAANCCLAPMTSTGLAGVTAREVNVAWLTVRPVEPVTESKLALILALPLPVAVAMLPCIVATAVFDDAQLAKLVMPWVEPSLNVPIAK